MLGLGNLISPIANLAGTWIQGKVDRAKAETDIKVAKARAEAEVFRTEATSEMLMEKELTSQMGDSLKDEMWSILFAGILLACFLPWTQPYVKDGFIFLDENCPTWFSNMLYIIIGSAFGMRFGKQGLKILKSKNGKTK